MQFAKHPINLLLCFGGMLYVAGCGGGSVNTGLQDAGPLIPVQGKVTLAGKPLRHGIVRLYPQGDEKKLYSPEGLIDTEGNYSLKTAGKPGAPAGKYRATVEPGSDDIKENLAVDPLYANWKFSPLQLTVAENTPAGTYDLKLVMKPQKK